MGEASRDKHLPLVVSRQHHTDPAAKASRTDSDIHRDVKDFAADHPAQFCLRVRELVMQPAKNSSVGYGVVFLNEYRFDPECGELFLMIGLEETSSRVFKDLGLNQEDAGQLGFCPFQA